MEIKKSRYICVFCLLRTYIYTPCILQEGFDYLRETREENLFVSMQQRLQQAIVNDIERRALLAQLESHMSKQEILVMYIYIYIYVCMY